MTKKTKVFGALKRRFLSKDGTRAIVVTGRHDDLEIKTRSGGTAMVAVWQVTSEQTGRTTKLRDDSLAKDYVPSKEVKPKPAVKPKPTKAEVPITKTIAPAVKPQLVNHVGFLLDSSGSMRAIADRAVEAFNANVAATKEQASKSGQRTTVSFATFGDGYGEVRERYLAEPIERLRPLNRHEFVPQGNTPLMDAVGRSSSGFADGLHATISRPPWPTAGRSRSRRS